jgi:hypothetical protein
LTVVVMLGLTKLLTGRRGVAPTAAAAFFVIAIAVSFNFMVLGAAYMELPSRQLSDRNLRLHDELAESVSFLSVLITNNKLNITLFNDGGTDLHIVSLWVTNLTASPGWHKGFNVNYWLSPGMIRTGVGNTTGNYAGTNLYALALITERGSRFESTYSAGNTIVSSVQGFGWLTVDWASYVYYYNGGQGHVLGPTPAWCSNLGNGLYMWSVKVINHFNQSVYLLSWSYLKFQSSGGNDQPFYIMDSSSTVSVPVPYSTEIELPANAGDQQTGGTPITLKFLAKTPNGVTQDSISNAHYSVVILFYYRWTDIRGMHIVGQTVPYEGTDMGYAGCPQPPS